MFELPPHELTLEWDPAGFAVHRCVLPLTQRIVPGTAVAVVPVAVRNATSSVQLPPELPIRVRLDELRELRGRIIAAPRRLILEEGQTRCEVRPFTRATEPVVRRRGPAGAIT
jgi:hypothetical protein